VQRSHQQIFETFPSVILAALAGAVSFPITSALAALTYAVGRVAFSNGYVAAEGDASKRYSSPLAKWMSCGILSTFILGFASCVRIVSSKKQVW
jgi:glutathione S-transferase